MPLDLGELEILAQLLQPGPSRSVLEKLCADDREAALGNCGDAMAGIPPRGELGAVYGVEARIYRELLGRWDARLRDGILRHQDSAGPTRGQQQEE